MKTREIVERVSLVIALGVSGALATKSSLGSKVQKDVEKALVGGATTTFETVLPTSLHQSCDGMNMACPDGQYCFITKTIGLPQGVCIKPGDAAP